MKTVRFHRVGGPEVLKVDDLPRPDPGPDQVRVAVHFCGVNYIDTYLRSGYYDPGNLPATAGKEGAGVIDAVGRDVSDFAVGDRVAFFDVPGAYAESIVHDARRMIRVPDGLDLSIAAALPLQGMTAHYLTQTIRPLGPSDRVLIHAAAGGVGGLAVQLARQAGAEVFGTCSTEAKAERVRSLGADHVIRYTETDFADEILRLTGGEGVDLAIDGVGRATFEGSVRATRLRGHVILFGQASGEPEPIRPRKLLGSRTLTTATLFDYTRTAEGLVEHAGPVFGRAAHGKLHVEIDRVLQLEDAGRAHALLEGRETRGKLLLTTASPPLPQI